MSVTVADLLKLPSLRNAEVVAGKQGLNRIVTSVSVLEYAEPSFLQDELFQNIEFFGSEIVITAFANIRDNVEAQCANIIRLNEAGEVGLILYYVGILLDKIDSRLIRLADSLGFILICMPKGRLDLRYSEAICDIMGEIYQDQTSNVAFTADILERITHLPVHQRTVDTVFKMLSDRLHLSLFLVSENGAVLNAITWPRTLVDDILRELPNIIACKAVREPIRLPLLNGIWVLMMTVMVESRPMSLYLLDSSEESPEASQMQQVKETVQLALNLWSSNHDRVAATELVRAILQDEPLKMRRLAEIFHIDVAAIHNMWIIHSDNKEENPFSKDMIQAVTSLAREYTTTVLCDIYEKELFLFMDGPDSLQETVELCTALETLMDCQKVQTVITCCNPLANTAQVRKAFLDNSDNIALLQKIFLRKKHFTLDEVHFAASCNEILGKGEQEIQKYESVIEPLHMIKDWPELLQTMETYLLDCDSSVTLTAQTLYVHPNTIKYRIRKLSDIFGRRIDQMPAAFDFYRAVALQRILRN